MVRYLLVLVVRKSINHIILATHLYALTYHYDAIPAYLSYFSAICERLSPKEYNFFFQFKAGFAHRAMVLKFSKV